MKIIKGIKVVKPKRVINGVRLYAEVPSRSHRGLTRQVVYVRTSLMRRWLCSCPTQLFRMTGRRRNCDHIHAVRQIVESR